ncbi:MAG: DNA circularization N-terminal domain-containing protein [Spirochaetota bacterium]
MSYQDRVRTAVYVAPSGSEHQFEFFELARNREKKAPINELPEREGADIQDLNQATLRIPITAYISGPDYDEAADAFWAALDEIGPGELRHPRWGNIAVLPVSISQTEDFQVNGRRARFEIEFVKPSTTAFPVTGAQRESAVEQSVNAFADAAATSLVEEVDFDDAATKISAAEAYEDGVAIFGEAVADLATADEPLSEQIQLLSRQLIDNMDTLIESPLELALEAIRLYRLPARTISNVWEKVRGYATLVEQLINNVEEAPTTQAIVALFQATAATGAMAEATLSGPIERRDRAVSAAETLRSTYASVMDAVEVVETADDGVDFRVSQEALVALDTAVSTAYGLLIERSYSLKSSRRIRLDSDATPIELAARFYPDSGLDEAIDHVIEENELLDSEIFLVPRGREVVYYA